MADGDRMIPSLVRDVLSDARTLLRDELQLARFEMRQVAVGLVSTAAAGAVAAGLGLIGIVLLTVAAGGALAYFFAVAAWIGYAILVGFAWIVAGGLFWYGRARAKPARPVSRRS